jgi:hypothetical protein
MVSAGLPHDRLPDCRFRSKPSQALRLQEIIETLRHLVDQCKGTGRPDCPIIAELGDGPVPSRSEDKNGKVRAASRDLR